MIIGWNTFVEQNSELTQTIMKAIEYILVPSLSSSDLSAYTCTLVLETHGLYNHIFL